MYGFQCENCNAASPTEFFVDEDEMAAGHKTGAIWCFCRPCLVDGYGYDDSGYRIDDGGEPINIPCWMTRCTKEELLVYLVMCE